MLKPIFKTPNSVVFSSPLTSPYQKISARNLRIKSSDLPEKFKFSGSVDSTPGEGLVSTQQIPLDWSKFENHTFFNSAEVNINVAFDTIINSFPFDGTESEIKDFQDSLTGFEKHIYDRFPKNVGYLRFQGNNKISINDIRGGENVDLSRVKDGSPALDPGAGSLSFQFKIFIPTITNQNMAIFQRLSGSDGYTLFVSSSASTSQADLHFYVSSGSASIYTSGSIQKGSWLDLCAQFNRKPGVNKLFLYNDGNLIASSSRVYEFSSFDTRGSQLLLGSGSSHSGTGFVFMPEQQLTGAMDDFKVYHKARTESEIKLKVSSSEYPASELKLFYKFNEPTGSYSQNSFILDSSGNGLHSSVTGFSQSNRLKIDGSPPTFEREEYNPVLFPDFSDLVSFNQDILSSGSLYDEKNPNLITKLVPRQYFDEGQIDSGFESVDGNIKNPYPQSGDTPRGSKLGAAQILSSLLYIWAKQFDEMKIFVDHFSKFESYDYVKQGSVADNFLQYQARNLGFELPKLFTTTNVDTLSYGDNIGADPGFGTESLTRIQSSVWRRIVASFPDIIRSKGTSYAVKSLIRAYGINPDTSLRLREYGGAYSGFIEGRINRRLEKSRLSVTGSWKIESPYLSGSRIEPGIPLPVGTIGLYGSSQESDGLFTSGSWTWESLYRYPVARNKNNPESLVRFYTTGSSGKSLLFNIVSEISSSSDPVMSNITLYGANSTSNSNPFSMRINGVPLYDGKDWYISFGRIEKTSDRSTWVLRAANSSNGEINSVFEVSSSVTCSQSSDIFSTISSAYNSSGSFFTIGTETVVPSSQFTSGAFPESSEGNFSGEISNIRFFSKGTEKIEFLERVRNIESVGVRDPSINYNFVTTESGSFERLRIDASMEQINKNSDSIGDIEIFDFSKNLLHLSGSGFSPLQTVIYGDDTFFSSLNPKFDERSSDNKVRIRSWSSEESVENWGGQVGPVYEVLKSEEPVDDLRFGIEISAVKGLNEDIISMFSDYQSIDNSIGSVSNFYDETYEDLETLMDIYYNRLNTKIDFRNIFLFSRWFEENISILVEQLLPANTKFLGTNFVIESHMLERSRVRYYWATSNLTPKERTDSEWNSEVPENNDWTKSDWQNYQASLEK